MQRERERERQSPTVRDEAVGNPDGSLQLHTVTPSLSPPPERPQEPGSEKVGQPK